ncbi:MAG: GAF domain-containing protein [Candidatus Kapaibacterium sp.]|nr:MAG: GAF domain-containing protein [Candidatus Kapabacteria bacterium]
MASLFVSRGVICCIVVFILSWCENEIVKAQEKPQVRGLDPTKPISEYRHNVWTADNGLPQNSAQALCQTRDGYLWIGTQEGLVRFDGQNFKVFYKDNAPAVTDKYISALMETSTGELWGGGLNGCLFSMQHGLFTKHSIEATAEVRTLAELHGRVWIGTSAGLYVWEQGSTSLRRFTTSEGLPDNAVLSLCADTVRGILWVGTQRGLSAFPSSPQSLPQGAVRTFRRTDGLADDIIRSLMIDHRGNLWIGSNGGLQEAQETSTTLTILTTFTEKTGLTDNVITALYEDTEKTLWIGTATQGIMRRTEAKRSFESYQVRDGLASNAINILLQDREGMVWIGCQQGGINLLANASFTSYSKENGLSSDFTWSLLQGRDGAMYFNTNDAGVARFQNGIFTFVNKQQSSLLSNAGTALVEDRDGVLWVGSAESGVSCVKEGRVIKTYTTANGLLGNNIRILFEDSKGRMWIGTWNGGLQYLENGKCTTFTEKDGLCNTQLRAIAEGRDGTIWIGTSGGLNALRPNASTLEKYTTANGLSQNHVIYLMEDSEGALWLGMGNGGLHRYKHGKFTHCGTEHGLFDENVYSIVDDRLGNFWMSCNLGVFRVSKAELNAFMDGKQPRISCTIFGKADGMKVAECNGGRTPAAWRSTDGRIWFANAAGVVVVDPRKIYKNPIPPNVIVEEVRVDGVPSTSASTLPSTAEKLEFQYTATCLTAAERVRFKYILEGYDKDWIEVGNRRTAYYNNLPRGRTYRFRVIACNNDGVWNETGAWVEFSITPFWWETWWFYGLCVLFVGSTSYQGFRWRTRRLRAKAEELERIVEIRTKEVQEQAREIQLANTQLSEKNAEITVSRERLEVMSEVGRSLTASLAVETIITNLYNRVAEVMDATVFGIGIIRAVKGVIEYKLAMDKGERFPPYERDLHDTNQFPVWSIREQKPVFINDVDVEGMNYIPSFREKVNVVRVTGDYAKSLLYVPLLLEGAPIGVLSVQSYERNAYSETDLDTLQTLANYAAIAIANAESTEEIIRQKAIVEEFNRNIQDSIRYAKRIQDAMLPSTETLNRLLPEHFIFFRPKDVVSGDFYWCRHVQGLVFVAAVDCTGHGVPGAFMSLIGNSLLNDITQRLLDPHPDLILNELHHELQTVLRQKETNNDDGMDMCLCMIDLDSRIVEFSGAMNPLYAIVAGELREFKGTPEELGGREERNPVYQRHSLDVSNVPQGATMLYLTTDGYKDQYNAEKQRFMPKRLRPLLTEIAGKPLQEQPRLLGAAIDAHKGDVMQVDDMLVLGVRL